MLWFSIWGRLVYVILSLNDNLIKIKLSGGWGLQRKQKQKRIPEKTITDKYFQEENELNNLDRSMVRTSDFKSENRGSIPRLGVFVPKATIIIYQHV